MGDFYTFGELAAQRLTGRICGRRGWFGRIVVQVEVLSPNPTMPAGGRSRSPQPPGAAYDPWRRGSHTFWRDALDGDLDRIGVFGDWSSPLIVNRAPLEAANG